MAIGSPQGLLQKEPRTPPRPSSNSIRFSRIHPAPPPLPPRPLYYTPRKLQIPTPLLPSASCSPPPTPSKRRASWILTSAEPVQSPDSALNAASVVMLTCGTILMFLCFLGIAESGRLYYLDSSLICGATYLIIGLLGMRTRYWTTMPNRNFVSGYIVLAILSFLITADILAMLVVRGSKAGGNSVTDMLGGAACGIALLTVVVAFIGLCTTRCCRLSPPDNRIGHCAEGLTL
ncbi:uncharacterized protein LOC132197578 [Neocloeon triangulifer]|uniref:uncharacterized protein LOC132197578 n=1 Tax=Neocloeon triangulifer TaxID=2078957 RepID=UPI00286F9F2D|nr:uncharacterized protein LOC132197578 [Neocloeon triangulifer]